MNIGVFDSGRGGEFIAEGLKKLLPTSDFTVVNDRLNVPYGSRSDDEIIKLTSNAILPLVNGGCPIIVIACNTATMAAIAAMRKQYPTIRFVGTEPMIKPAGVASVSRHITVLATPLTLRSERYKHLVNSYAGDLTIDQPDTSGWAAAIESNAVDSLSYTELGESIAQGSDTIILACTHYLVLQQKLTALFPDTTILEPTNAIAKQITRLIEELEAEPRVGLPAQ